MKIATLGPQGTYSEQATQLFLKRLRIQHEDSEIIFTTVTNALRLIQNRQVDYAVLPAENMIDGLIGSTFDALIEFQDFVKVCDEIHLQIRHVLAGVPEVIWGNIERILSHPSPLNQCQNNLETYFPNADLIPVLSTAEAAQIVKNDISGKTAAICSRDNAVLNQMAIYPKDIQDSETNETRFLVCGLTDSPPTGNDRTLVAVRYGGNQPGQLFMTAKYFAEADVDLTFIQSRPYKVKPQEYVLLFEFIGHKSAPGVEAALRNIELQVRSSNGWKKILGSYPRREREQS